MFNFSKPRARKRLLGRLPSSPQCISTAKLQRYCTQRTDSTSGSCRSMKILESASSSRTLWPETTWTYSGKAWWNKKLSKQPGASKKQCLAKIQSLTCRLSGFRANKKRSTRFFQRKTWCQLCLRHAGETSCPAFTQRSLGSSTIQICNRFSRSTFTA